MSFRLLAKVLAYAAVIEPTMMEYAQTAYSLQFSVVDVRLKVPVKGRTLGSDCGRPPVTYEEDLNPHAFGAAMAALTFLQYITGIDAFTRACSVPTLTCAANATRGACARTRPMRLLSAGRIIVVSITTT